MNQRLNVTLTNDHVLEVLQLRSLLEKRLKQHLSIAQVMKRLIKYALEEELANISNAAE